MDEEYTVRDFLSDTGSLGQEIIFLNPDVFFELRKKDILNLKYENFK